MKYAGFVLSLMLPALTVAAHSARADVFENWNNNIELGAVRTDGNTRTLTLNAKSKFMHEGVRLRDTITASANNSTDRNTTTAENYKASFQEDWKVTDRDFLFLRYAFESDRFAGISRRFSETAGYGRDLLKTDILLWRLEIGGGLRQSHLSNGSRKNEAIGRSATLFEWKISDSAVFTQTVSTEGGKSGWASESISSLQHKLNAWLASKISLKLEHNSKVPAGVKKLDIESAITMVVNF